MPCTLSADDVSFTILFYDRAPESMMGPGLVVLVILQIPSIPLELFFDGINGIYGIGRASIPAALQSPFPTAMKMHERCAPE